MESKWEPRPTYIRPSAENLNSLSVGMGQCSNGGTDSSGDCVIGNDNVGGNCQRGNDNKFGNCIEGQNNSNV